MTSLIIGALPVFVVLLTVIGFLLWRNQSSRPTMHLEEALLQNATRQMHAAAHDPHTMSSLQELARDVRRALASRFRSHGYASYVAVRHALLVVSVFDPKGKRQKQEFVKDFESSIESIVRTAGNNRGLTVASLQRQSFSSPFMAAFVYMVQTTTAKPDDPTSAASVPPFSSRRDTFPYDGRRNDHAPAPSVSPFSSRRGTFPYDGQRNDHAPAPSVPPFSDRRDTFPYDGQRNDHAPAASVPPFSDRRDTSPYDGQHSDMPGTDHGESRRNVRPPGNGDDLFNMFFFNRPGEPRS